MKRNIVIPIFVPHMGCPFDCIYCNQKKISGQIENMTPSLMKNIIDRHLSSIDSKNTFVEIGFYGGSFTGIPEDEQIAFLKTANEYLKKNKVHSIRLSTRPDFINAYILKYLSDYNVSTIELGVQSMDNSVLLKSCRGHDEKTVYKAVDLIHKNNFTLGIQTMIGLPGDTREKDIITANIITALKPSIVRIYPTLVIRDTYLADIYHSGEYTPLSLEEAVETSALLLQIYRDNNINVIRIGLQPTETMRYDVDIIAGPFHPAFRQLVESRIVLNELIKYFKQNYIYNLDNITISVNGKNMSNLIGQHKSNIKYLSNRFGIKHINVKSNNEVRSFSINI